MGQIKEKVSYIQGLIDGLSLSEESKEGKVIAAIVEALGEIAEAVEANEETIGELDESVDELYDAVDSLENELAEDEDEDEDDEDDDFLEIVCPHCNESIYFDHDMLESEEELICPNCNKPIVPAEETDD